MKKSKSQEEISTLYSQREPIRKEEHEKVELWMEALCWGINVVLGCKGSDTYSQQHIDAFKNIKYTRLIENPSLLFT